MKKRMKTIEISIILGVLVCILAWHVTNSVFAEPRTRTPKQAVEDVRTPQNANTKEKSRYRTYVIPEVQHNSDGYYEPRFHRTRNLSVPAYQTDMDKLTASYERILDRFINTIDRCVLEIDGTSDSVMAKLQTIEQKIDGIDQRIARIENALNIEGDIPDAPKPPRE